MKTVITPDYQLMLNTAIQQAQKGLKEGGIPIGAALFSTNGTLLGKGRNRRIQNDDPSVHGETDAFRDAGRKLSYSNIIMVTTLAPCWYCSGLIRQFKIKTVIVGESVNFSGGVEWLKQNGIEIIDLNSDDCISMLANYIKDNPEIWNEDIGEE
ncbi:MAG: nucleoside deaminase [Candidatus Marinimicrobia bacterium]|nr:nucleoside deaminase [Candidatus Neomarinimicrobiota bacterium]